MNTQSVMDGWVDEEEVTGRWSKAAGARVLVVDDDPAMRDLVAGRLASEGYNVFEAGTGLELLRIVQAVYTDRYPLDGVDLLILDQRMPGLTGMDVVRKLRAAQWNVPAILMTAFPSSDLTDEAARHGVLVLPKPFPLEALTHAVLLRLLNAQADSPHSFRVPS